VALRALATVNLGAVRRNAARLAGELRDAQLCAVVKADGYGHGAVPAARAALAGGASWLAVATAGEAAELRTAGWRDLFAINFTFFLNPVMYVIGAIAVAGFGLPLWWAILAIVVFLILQKRGAPTAPTP